MDASERLKTEYLTCPQCTEPFNQPKTLPCLHNFCKACLSSYLEKEMEGGKGTTFNCPDCREKIYVPDPSKAVERWASQFPTNFVLTGMIEAIEEEEGEDGPDGEKVKAAKERRGVRCGDNSPRQQQSIDEDLSLGERLTKAHNSVKNEGAELSKYLNEIQATHQQQVKRLEMSFKKIQELIDFRKIQLLEELEDSYSDEKKRIQQARQSYTHDVESLKSCNELLKGLEQRSLSKGVATDMLEAIQEQVREIEIRPVRLVARGIKFDQKLEAGRSILNLIENLGSITITSAGEEDEEAEEKEEENTTEETETPGEDGKRLAKPKLIATASAKDSEGKFQQVHGVTVMPSGSVIMTAYGEKAILAARHAGDKYIFFSSLEIDTEPRGIVAISPHYVAVAGDFCVYIVGVTSEKLILKQMIKTGKSYTGIAAYSESSLILTCQSPPSVDFVGLNGFISETIEKDLTTNTILFKKPHFITTSEEDGVIYVIDQSSAPVLKSINNAGKIMFTYPDDKEEEGLMAPQGVACDSQGGVYVVDRGHRCVTLLNHAGEKVKDILTSRDGLTDPCAIAIDKDDKIYVTNDFSEVLIFEMGKKKAGSITRM